MSDKFDPYQKVTDRIVEYFESSEQPNWKAPWSGNSMPMNALSGREYHGINVLLLDARMHEEEWDHPLFLTFKQVQALAKANPEEKCHVRKGSTSEAICFWTRVTRKDKETGEEKVIPILRMYNVFNVAQVECSDSIREILLDNAVHGKLDENDRNMMVDMFLDNLGSNVRHHGNRAYYHIVEDTITMPPFTSFASKEAYYATRLHEEAHRTGHESRCNRDLKNRFGSDAYAFEEMVAEITSAYLCTRFGLESTLQHPEYIKIWCGRMKGDKYAIFTASSLARKAMAYMDGEQDADDEQSEPDLYVSMEASL
jgi:antirestriction protein ArdC